MDWDQERMEWDQGLNEPKIYELGSGTKTGIETESLLPKAF